MMPYVTEELFQRLHSLGLHGAVDPTPSHSVMLPLLSTPVSVDDATDAVMGKVLGVVRASRSLVKAVTDVVPDVRQGPLLAACVRYLCITAAALFVGLVLNNLCVLFHVVCYPLVINGPLLSPSCIHNEQPCRPFNVCLRYTSPLLVCPGVVTSM